MISQADYLQMLARTQPKQPHAKSGCDDESELHQQIANECLGRGWLAFHGSMAHKTYRTEGEPDFVILREGGVLLVECKTRTGKQTTEQLAVAAWANRLGFTVHVVRSFEDFIALCK